jgi:hypothetical protein
MWCTNLFNQLSVFMATLSKPNIEIWRFLTQFFFTSGDGNPGKSLHLRFFSLFGEIVKKRLKSPNQRRCSWAVIKTPKNKTPLLSAGF